MWKCAFDKTHASVNLQRSRIIEQKRPGAGLCETLLNSGLARNQQNDPGQWHFSDYWCPHLSVGVKSAIWKDY